MIDNLEGYDAWSSKFISKILETTKLNCCTPTIYLQAIFPFLLRVKRGICLILWMTFLLSEYLFKTKNNRITFNSLEVKSLAYITRGCTQIKRIFADFLNI